MDSDKLSQINKEIQQLIAFNQELKTKHAQPYYSLGRLKYTWDDHAVERQYLYNQSRIASLAIEKRKIETSK
jgi:hypothetical protein